MALPAPTVFEIGVLTHQPKMLKFMAGKFLAVDAMLNDNIMDKLDKYPKVAQDLIAPHLTGKWFFQYLGDRGSSLTLVEKSVDTNDKKQLQNFVTILQTFFTEMQNNDDTDVYSTMFESYLTNCCKTVDYHPTRLYQIGIREQLCVWHSNETDFLRNYLGSDKHDYNPSFNPLNVPDRFINFKNSIYTSKNPPLPMSVDTRTESDRFEVPRRLCWSKWFIKHERMPEALCQLLACLIVLQPKVNTQVEFLDVFTMLILVFSRLHVNIRATTLLLTKAFTLVKYNFELHQFSTPLIAFFSELGHFHFSRMTYVKLLDKNKQSIFYTSSQIAYLECIFEQLENNYLYVITIREYHKRCVSRSCLKENAQGIMLDKMGKLFQEACAILENMQKSHMAHFLNIKYKMFLLCFYHISNNRDGLQPLLTIIKGQIDSFKLRVDVPHLLSLQVEALDSVISQRGDISFRNLFDTKLAQVTFCNLSNIKNKLVLNCIVWLSIYYNPKYPMSTVRTNIETCIEYATLNINSLTNKKCYRLRLMYLMDQVFVSRHVHQAKFLSFKPTITHISLTKQMFLLDNIAPNFARLEPRSLPTLFENKPWVLPKSFPCYRNEPNFYKRLLLLDPFMRQHISFGAAQLKYHSRYYKPLGKPTINFAPVNFFNSVNM